MSDPMTGVLIGNLASEPELRYTSQGHAVLNFRVAASKRRFDRSQNTWVDGNTSFVTVEVWRTDAENFSRSLQKGMRIVAWGGYELDTYTRKDGSTGSDLIFKAQEVGASLKFADVTVTRRGPGGGGAQRNNGQNQNQGNGYGYGGQNQGNGYGGQNQGNGGGGNMPSADPDPFSAAPQAQADPFNTGEEGPWF